MLNKEQIETNKKLFQDTVKHYDLFSPPNWKNF